MIEELLRETFTRHEALAPESEEVRTRIEAVARQRRRKGYVIKGTAAVVAAFALLVAGVSVNLERLRDGAPLPPAQAVLTRPTGPLTLLLVGLDQSSDRQPRADTVLLAHLPAHGEQAYLISVPRAGSAASTRAGWVAEFNRHGIVLDGAVEVEYRGFVAVTDAAGGVDLCVDRRVVSEHWGIDDQGRFVSPAEGGRPMVYEPGCRRFTGVQALDYLRQRKGLPDGDRGRQRHVRRYLTALLDRLAADDPQRVLAVLAAAGDAVRVDTGRRSLLDLVLMTRGLTSRDVVSIGAPGTEAGELAPAAEGLWTALRSGTLPTWVVANPDHVD
jgi:anionic cell wall polymer biosynthesis LytR-Cps2A-Psr (LCP) family protein